MENFKMTYSDIDSAYGEDNLYHIGYSENDSVFIITTALIIAIRKHNGEFDLFEFTEDEIKETEFKEFALYWCQNYCSEFKTVKRYFEEQKIKISDDICNFIRKGYYGEQETFQTDKTAGLEITIIPGGAIYRFYGGISPIFVPYSEFEKELNLKCSK